MKRMKWVSGLLPAILVVAVGCGGGSASTGDTTPGGATAAEPATSPGDVAQVGAGEDEDESTNDLAEHHRHHHHGGFAMFIAMSVDGLGTTPDQDEAIEKIQADMHAKMQPAHDAEKVVLMTLADGVAAGNVDQAKVDAAIAQMSAASAGIHDAIADSVNQLHATLTPPQRVALVDKVEAHFEVWHHSNAPEETADRDKHGGHLGKLAKQLALSPDQVEKIRVSFKMSNEGKHFDRGEAEQHMKAFGAAFASETFDAKSLTAGGAVNAHMATWGETRMAHLYEAAAPVLTPEQRTKLADELRRHANYKRTESAT
jgi:Spy/CpxP family protein refolding chaperone